MTTTQSETYAIGQPVVTNRVFGSTEWADEATVVGIAPTHLTIKYTAPGLHDGDFAVVNRTYPNVRPA